jgi:hypothetical protein
MGLLSKLFTRRTPQDKFARLIMRRIRQSGDSRAVEYDPEQFSLSNGSNRLFYLHNIYSEYLRISKAQQEDLFRHFLATWHTSDLKPPGAFEDARADILPALRARAMLEIDLHRVSDTLQSAAELPHQVIAEHLAALLVYDLPSSTMTVSDELLNDWGVSFYEAMEIALQNLRERTTEYAQIGSVYAFGCGDSYDATRLLLTDLLQTLEVDGDVIAMVPNRERLYVCGSNDATGLETMISLAAEDIQHERNICGLPLILTDDGWELWIPPTDHPLRNRFDLVRAQWLAQLYSDQAELLNARHQRDGKDIYVASYTAFQNEHTGKVTSTSVWTKTVETLLPETDQIAFIDPDLPEGQQFVAQVDWETARAIVGDMMQPAGMYPERWHVSEFPVEDKLAAIVAAKSPDSLV